MDGRCKKHREDPSAILNSMGFDCCEIERLRAALKYIACRSAPPSMGKLAGGPIESFRLTGEQMQMIAQNALRGEGPGD